MLKYKRSAMSKQCAMPQTEEFARQYVKNLQQQLFLRKSGLVLKIKFTKVKK